jgi:hypothetical protein
MYRSVFAQRDLRLLLGAMFVSLAGSWAYSVALLAVVFERTGSLGWVGAATVGRFVPQLLFSPYAGVIADRFQRVRVMIGSDLLAGAMQLGLAVAVAATAPVTLLIVLAALTAVACAPYEPAISAVLPEMVEEDDLVAANALRGVITNVVQVAGPAAAALVLIVLPDWSVFALNGASFGISALVIMRLRYRSRPVDVTEAGASGPLRQMLVGLREIGRSSRVALLVGLCLLASFIYGTDTVLLLGAAEDRLDLGADGFGLLLAGLAGGGMLAAATVNRLAGSQRLALVLIVGMTVYCLPNVLLAVSESPVLAIAAQVLRGAGTLVVDVLAVTALQRAVAPEVTARVFGVFWALVLSSISLGALVAPSLVDGLGLEGALVAVAVAPVVLSLATLPGLLQIDAASAAGAGALAARADALHRAGLFAAAPRPVLERLAAASSDIAAPAGTVVIREGEPADELYVVLGGSVEVTSPGAAGPLATIGPGGVFGEVGLLERVPRTATVTAVAPSDLLRIEGPAFLDAATAAPLSPATLEGARARFAGRGRPTASAPVETLA